MNDWAQGKQMTEEVIFQTFEEAFEAATGREIECLSQGESPDFEVLLDKAPTGVELTEIRKAKDEEDLFFMAYGQAYKKHCSYSRRSLFSRRPIILVCYSYDPPYFDIKRELEDFFVPEDFEGLGFSEIWLMDLAAAYHGNRDWRRQPDFFCTKPKEWRGFHRIGHHDRKPYG
jgi:hypothetical protein